MEPKGQSKIGPERGPSTNPVQKTGRPDGTEALKGEGTSTNYPAPKSTNPTKRGSAASDPGPQDRRGYVPSKTASPSVTDSSAGRVQRSVK